MGLIIAFIGFVIAIIVIVVFAIIGSAIGSAIDSKVCPHCKKGRTLVRMNETILSKEPVSKVEKQSVKDKAGNVVGTYEQRVYGERQTIEYIYKCSNCGKLSKEEKYVDRWF